MSTQMFIHTSAHMSTDTCVDKHVYTHVRAPCLYTYVLGDHGEIDLNLAACPSAAHDLGLNDIFNQDSANAHMHIPSSVHVFVHNVGHMSIHVSAHTPMHTCIHTYLHVYTHVYTSFIHTSTSTSMHTGFAQCHAHLRLHVATHVYTNVYMHADARLPHL